MTEIGLRAYVHRRTGVPLGGRGENKAMFVRAFTAPTLAGFWLHWNPIWGWALGRFVMRPSLRFLPRPAALVLTFVLSGLIHDAVVMLLRRDLTFIFSPWFAVCALGVWGGARLNIDFRRLPPSTRAACHFGWLASAFLASQMAMHASGVAGGSLVF